MDQGSYKQDTQSSNFTRKSLVYVFFSPLIKGLPGGEIWFVTRAGPPGVLLWNAEYPSDLPFFPFKAA